MEEPSSAGRRRGKGRASPSQAAAGIQPVGEQLQKQPTRVVPLPSPTSTPPVSHSEAGGCFQHRAVAAAVTNTDRFTKQSIELERDVTEGILSEPSSNLAAETETDQNGGFVLQL